MSGNKHEVAKQGVSQPKKAQEKEQNLPSIQELYKDTDMAIKENKLNFLLNQEPNPKWIKEHPTAKKTIKLPTGEEVEVPILYLPINRVEWLLTRIFLKWRVSIKKVQLIANSVEVTIRLYYRNPLDFEWDWNDGTGAVPIQIKSGSKSAIAFEHMRSNSIQLASPSAESFAVKDAAEKIGRIFGKDLNRDAISYYDSSIKKDVEKLSLLQLRNKLSGLINNCKNQELRKQVQEEAIFIEDQGSGDLAGLYQELIDKLNLENDAPA